MGRINKGILGGFSGKVGTVVGASWKGIAYMRSLPQSVKNPRTLPQRTQRTRFSVALGFLKIINAVLRVGWKEFAVRQSAINAAMSYTIDNAVTGDYPDYAIDPAKIVISRGGLTGASVTELGGSDGSVMLKWTDNSGVGSALATDKVLAAVVNQSKGDAITVVGGVARSTGRQEIVCPVDWSGDLVYCYLGFVSEDGKVVSNSVYMGSVTID